MDDLAAILWDRFTLRRDTYAQQLPNGSYNREEKALTLGIIRRHLAGGRSVGVYALKDGKCVWGCTDFDSETQDPYAIQESVKAFIGTCRHFELAPLVEFSGKKGWHVWLFFEEMEARLVRQLLAGLVRETGEENFVGCTYPPEMFPKQDESEFGNLVKLPLGKRADNGKRSVVVDPETLEPVEAETLLPGLTVYSETHVRELIEENGWGDTVAIAKPKPNEGKAGFQRSAGGAYRGELPCLEAMLDREGTLKIPAGHRNNVLFAFTNQIKRRGSSERVAFNQIIDLAEKRCEPGSEPISEKEVRKTVASCYKSNDSSACCDTIQAAKLCPVLLWGEACPVFEKGVEKRDQKREALNADATRLTIQPLYVMRMEGSPIYTATIRGRELQLTLDEMDSWRLFSKRCFAVLDFFPEPPFIPTKEDPKKSLPPQAAWKELVNEAMAGVIEQDAPPEDASPRGVVWAEIRAFLLEGDVRENRDEVRLGSICLDTIAGVDYYLFRGEDLRRRLKLNRVEDLPIGQVWKLIHDKGGKSGAVDTPSHGKIRMWQIPASAVREDGEIRLSVTPAFTSPPRGLVE